MSDDAEQSWHDEWNDWSTAERVDWTDIGWTVLIRNHGHVIQFKAFEITGEEITGPNHPGALLYEERDAHSSADVTANLDEAMVWFAGSVKWDGCSDWTWDTEATMFHLCGYAKLLDLLTCQRRIYREAQIRLDNWSAELAGDPVHDLDGETEQA